MKRLRTLTGLMAICAASVFMTGCGDDDDNGGGGGPVQIAPDAVADTYTLTAPEGNYTLTLASAGTSYTLVRPDNTTESGNYTASRSGDVWTVNTTTDDLTTTKTVTLTFTANNAGTFTVEQAGQPTISGNFAKQGTGGGGTDTAGTDTAGTDTAGTDTAGTDTAGTDTAGTDTAGTDTAGTDTAGTDTAGTDGGTDGAPAPASLSRVDVVNTQSGTGPSSYTINLSGGASGTFTISGGSVGQGNYTYTPSGNSARLVLTYTDFVGDQDDMTLNFRQPPAANTHTGTQRIGSETYTIQGTFTYAQ